MLVLWTGGAHCCYLDQIFDFSNRPARKTEIDFRDTARTRHRQRPAILQSADDRFDYAFTDYADSASPIQVWQYRGGGLVDTTRSFPGLVGTDAAHWWSRYLATGRRRRTTSPRHPRCVGRGRVAARRRPVGPGQLLQIAATVTSTTAPAPRRVRRTSRASGSSWPRTATSAGPELGRRKVRRAPRT